MEARVRPGRARVCIPSKIGWPEAEASGSGSGRGATLSIPDTPPRVNAESPGLLRKMVVGRDLQLGPSRAMPCLMEPAHPPNLPTPSPDPGPPTGVALAPGVRVAEAALGVAFVRSSGPGGQNVNKRATKCQLRIPLDAIPLSAMARTRLVGLAGANLTDAGEILIQDDSTRSAARNRDACMDRLRELVMRAMVVPKKRRPTKPSRGAVQRRIDEKKQRGEKKQRRQRPED